VLFLHAAQTAPLGVPHFLKSTYRSGDTVRLRAERANETRALRIRRALDDNRPAGLAQLVERRLERNDLRLAQRKNRLGYRLRRDALHCCALCGTCPTLCRCPACCRPICPNRSHFLCSFPRHLFRRRNFSPQLLQLQKLGNYLRRSTMCLSVRLLWRVFLPNVGKAHGVCG
jgi:hypothetical protein